MGESDQADVGDELELKVQLLFLAGTAGLPFARRLAGRAGVRGIAAAAAPAPGRDADLAVRGEVEKDGAAVLFLDDRTHRDPEPDLGAPPAMAVVALAGSPVLGLA